MGTWGVSLYSSDDPLDLRGSIRAVCRPSYDGDELVELLADLNSDTHDPDKEGHRTFKGLKFKGTIGDQTECEP